jgi:hypothetical protein
VEGSFYLKENYTLQIFLRIISVSTKRRKPTQTAFPHTSTINAGNRLRNHKEMSVMQLDLKPMTPRSSGREHGYPHLLQGLQRQI